MSIEEKFNAAVNVIRSLPKSGSYQPSNEMMLKFYSLFKQATEGVCDKPKPGFWDVINRAKWEAWHKLGDMPPEAAMKAYVNELHKIVETMSLSDDVAAFLTAGDDGDDGLFPAGDLELVAGDVLQRVRSERNTPAGSLSASPVSSPPRVVSPPPRYHHDSEDEFIDTIDTDPDARRTAYQLSNGHAHQITSQLTHLKVLEELPGTLARLERDVAALRRAIEGDRARVARGWRWPWQELSPSTLALVLLWPILAYKLLTRRRQLAS